jgi:hypothetical protein
MNTVRHCHESHRFLSSRPCPACTRGARFRAPIYRTRRSQPGQGALPRSLLRRSAKSGGHSFLLPGHRGRETANSAAKNRPTRPPILWTGGEARLASRRLTTVNCGRFSCRPKGLDAFYPPHGRSVGFPPPAGTWRRTCRAHVGVVYAGIILPKLLNRSHPYRDKSHELIVECEPICLRRSPDRQDRPRRPARDAGSVRSPSGARVSVCGPPRWQPNSC